MMRVSSRTRFRKPKPGVFFKLNFDVLFLIAEYLHPKALLNLSRTCKSLRGFLMDESSMFIWKTARRQVDGLPDCPTDLTEPEYADLVFDAHCHRCGWSAKTILWYIRRRYCRDCKLERLVDISSCDEVIRNNQVLHSEDLTIEKESAMWVDIEQMELFLDEYHQSSDKEQFLHERLKQYRAIFRHAFACESWRDDQERARRKNLALGRKERHDKIFERLEKRGYGPEIEYFGQPRVRDSNKPVFRTSKPLTDKEWCKMRGEWRRIMEDFRSQRLEEVVYPSRRHSLATEYKTYVTHPPPDTPTFDLLPHVADIARFPTFRDIIKAAEETRIDDKLFATAFAQLPTSVDEWRKNLDTEIAALVKIPSDLSSGDIAAGQVVASSSTTPIESSQTNTDKLHLACALFRAGGGVYTHPEVLSVCMRHTSFHNDTGEDSRHAESVEERFSIRFVEGASHIVRACGLDPNVATVDDMDRRNARLTWNCLCDEDLCDGCLFDGCPCSELDTRDAVMNWRDAVRLATSSDRIYRYRRKAPYNALRWQLLSDEYIDAIQAVEQSVETLTPQYTRCLLCLPCVGDAMSGDEFAEHLMRCHNIEKEDIKRGVHYIPLGISDSPPVAEMVKEGEQVTFRVSRQYQRVCAPLTRGRGRYW